jgi:hypothetical protein
LASFRADENIGRRRRRPFRILYLGTRPIYPAPLLLLISFSSLFPSRPYYIYLSISLCSLLFESFVSVVVGGQPASAARPLVLPFRSCHFHLLRVLRRVLIRTLDPRQHAVMLCALPLLSFTLSISFPSVSQSHLITSIQFSLFFYFPFLFYLVLSSCCLN